MDNIGDWFYIVLFVIFGINAFFGSLLKKKAQNQTSQETSYDIEEESDTLWESKADNSMEEPINHLEERINCTHVNTELPKNETHNQYKPLTELKKPEESSSQIIQLDNTEDLKKAIICSEIFNRRF